MITNILNSIIFPIELLLASYICAVRINKRSGKYAYQRIYRIFKHYTPQRIAFILDL